MGILPMAILQEIMDGQQARNGGTIITVLIAPRLVCKLCGPRRDIVRCFSLVKIVPAWFKDLRHITE